MYYHGGKLAHFIGEQVADNCAPDPDHPDKICDNYAEWSWATPITGGGTINVSSLPLAKMVEIAERSSAALQAAAYVHVGTASAIEIATRHRKKKNPSGHREKGDVRGVQTTGGG